MLGTIDKFTDLVIQFCPSAERSEDRGTSEAEGVKTNLEF